MSGGVWQCQTSAFPETAIRTVRNARNTRSARGPTGATSVSDWTFADTHWVYTGSYRSVTSTAEALAAAGLTVTVTPVRHMTKNDAESVCRSYRESRTDLIEAVVTLHQLGESQTQIVHMSGLSREGVRRILARAYRSVLTPKVVS